MTSTIGYAVIFFVTFGIVAIAVAFGWMMVDRKPENGDEPDILRRRRVSTLQLLSQTLERGRLGERLNRLAAEADVDWSAGRVTLTSAVAFVLCLAVLGRFDFIPGWGAFGLACLAAYAPIFYIKRLREKRLSKVEDQLPEALEFLARALVAGHSLPMALELLGEEAETPISTEVRKTVDEYNLGLSMEKSLSNMADRVPSVDIQFFVSAVTSQSRTGGNLHDLLDSLAETIRDRETLRGQVRALTANGRITAIILTCLPFFIAGVMLMVNSEYLSILTSTTRSARLLILAGICGKPWPSS